MSEPVEQLPRKRSYWVAYLLLAVAIVAGGITFGGYKLYKSFEALPKIQPLKANEMIYVGFWQAKERDNKLEIFPDGSANYLKTSGTNNSANRSFTTGGTIKFSGDKLNISILWFDQTFTIDQPPLNGVMVLSGITYYKGKKPADFKWENIKVDNN